MHPKCSFQFGGGCTLREGAPATFPAAGGSLIFVLQSFLVCRLSASCCENYAIQDDVSGQTLRFPNGAHQRRKTKTIAASKPPSRIGAAGFTMWRARALESLNALLPDIAGRSSTADLPSPRQIPPALKCFGNSWRTRSVICSTRPMPAGVAPGLEMDDGNNKETDGRACPET